ncbi:MAG: hypothetical protein IPJ14_14840 [Kineosporiaceae bacterium]|nr:hypothetical protein [Kineosporiaceae bacterium]MBK7623894.1 hypothetical protein [Kineosporiaceae bacterium]
MINLGDIAQAADRQPSASDAAPGTVPSGHGKVFHGPSAADGLGVGSSVPVPAEPEPDSASAAESVGVLHPPMEAPSAPSAAESVVSGWPRALVATGVSVVLAVLFGLIAGGGSLLIDLALALWIAAVSVTRRLRTTSADLPRVTAGLGRLVTGVRGAGQGQGRLVAGSPLAVVALALSPVLVGLVFGVSSALHHSSEGDVCDAYLAYRQETDKPSTSMFDSAWFDALDHLGKVAEDYGGNYQPEVTRAAGKRARAIAKGSGSGHIVTASVGQADAAVAPLSDFCGMGD